MHLSVGARFIRSFMKRYMLPVLALVLTAGWNAVAAEGSKDGEATQVVVSSLPENVKLIIGEGKSTLYVPRVRAVHKLGDDPFRFSSEYADDETGLVYYNYRYYSPELGRWVKRDIIEEKGWLNVYGFVHNSPSLLLDVNGLLGEMGFPGGSPGGNGNADGKCCDDLPAGWKCCNKVPIPRFPAYLDPDSKNIHGVDSKKHPGGSIDSPNVSRAFRVEAYCRCDCEDDRLLDTKEFIFTAHDYNPKLSLPDDLIVFKLSGR